jgi:hypothetical protein
MAVNHFPVIPVGTLPRSTETKGSRRKFWVLGQDERTEWLLKFPRPNTGEHWAEKIVAEIGTLIGANCAPVELARCAGQLGTICQSFIQVEEDENDTNVQLPSPLGDTAIDFLHGWEILGSVIDGYDADLRFNQRQHNAKYIIDAIIQTAHVDSLNPYALWDVLLRDLAAYVLLDGLVGNTDRHHGNWMVMYMRDAGNPKILAAPSFDHASSLGRELSDERRRQMMNADGVLHYLRRGHGGVYVDSRRRHALPPLRLAQLLCRWQPEFTRKTLTSIEAVTNLEFKSVIDRIPPEFMSETAKEFAYQVVIISKAQLLRSAR